MVNLSSRHATVNPGRPDRRPPTSAKSSDPHRLDGPARRAWEESIKGRPGLKGSRKLVLLALLDIARGKPWGFPSDAYLADKCGVSDNTIWRSLRDLAAAGIIRIVKARGRRWLVFTDHPHAAAFVAGLGVAAEPDEIEPAKVDAPPPAEPAPEAAPHDGIPAPQIGAAFPQIGIRDPQNGGRSVVVKPGEEARHEPAPACECGPGTGISLPVPNDPTTDGPLPSPGPSPAPRPPIASGRRLRGIPDLAEAPADEPVIAAELARRARAREAAAPSRDEILAVALASPAVGEGPGAEPVPIPEIAGRPDVEARSDPGEVDREAQTIAALSRLGPGATPGDVVAATARLTTLFRDPGSRAYYRGIVNQVVRGQLPARVPIAAVGSARGLGVRKPGAAFTAHIKRAQGAAESRRVARDGS